MTNNLAARTREIALTLTAWPSVTGSADEAAFAARLADYLQGFDEVWTAAIPGDAAGRGNVFALKRGKGRRSIVLTGHFDTVPRDDYGDLYSLALCPEELRPAIIARLELSGEHPLALADLKSGDFLPGRGLLDMKAGLAAGIAVIESYRGEANLLFIAVADEEDRSAGARAAVPLIPKIAKDHGLDIELIINLDAIADQGVGRFGQSAAFGSIGKYLLCAYVTGKESHACYPFSGVNAAYLAAELVAEFECAPELAEITGPEIAAPPTILQMRDLKQGYNVTTPGHVWIYWNVLSHRREPGEILRIARELAGRAVARARARLDERRAVTGRPENSETWSNVQIMDFEELIGPLRGTPVFEEKFLAYKASQAGEHKVDFPTRSKVLFETAHADSGLHGPVIIFGFASIPYQPVTCTARLRDIVMGAIENAGFPVGAIQYFPGISDMSFFGQGPGGLEEAEKNTPIWGASFNLDGSPGYPCINIGPWGRDYHHWLERLHAPYAFETLPKVLLAVIEAVFKRG